MSSGVLLVVARVKISCARPLGPGNRTSRSTPRSAASSAVPSVTGTPCRVTRADDLVERRVVVELPAEGGDILGTSPLQQEPALVVVEPESHDIGKGFVEVHADGVAAEAPPVGEPLGFDDDVAEVHVAEDASHGRVSNPGSGTR